MQSDLPFDPLWLIPVLLLSFVGLWLAVTGVVGLASGWFRLQRAFPDRMEQPVQRLRFQSGAMGGPIPANFGSSLTLEICPTGLRVRLLRLLGPLQQPFFVPWASIETRRRRILFRDFCELRFGRPPVGNLILPQRIASTIAAAGPLRMPG